MRRVSAFEPDLVQAAHDFDPLMRDEISAHEIQQLLAVVSAPVTMWGRRSRQNRRRAPPTAACAAASANLRRWIVPAATCQEEGADKASGQSRASFVR
jgi:hypothetical protein